jgi:hypothetical protein
MRFPYEKRLSKRCIDCGGKRSRPSTLGRGRCRGCYFQYRRIKSKTKLTDAWNNEPYFCHHSIAARRRKTRAVDRPGVWNYLYPDRYGVGHHADEELLQGLTAAAAWSCLRKCWKGYKIAAGKLDEDLKVVYARRIINLCRLLDIDEPEFLELYEWPTGQAADSGGVEIYYPTGDVQTPYLLHLTIRDYYYYYYYYYPNYAAGY